MEEHAPLPSPEALEWVQENILTREEKEQTNISQNPASVSNNPTATLTTPNRILFVKQLQPYWNHNIETLITKQLSPHPKTLTYVADNARYKLIITEHITPVSQPEWNTITYLDALNTFTEIQTLMTPKNFPQQAELPFPIMMHIPSNKDHMLYGLNLIENNQQATPFTRGSKHAQTINYLTRTALNAIYTAPTLLQHTDATPENWMLTENAPILIDYGCYAYAPYYWDTSLLTITAPLSPKTKLASLTHNDFPLITYTALYFLTILLGHEKDPGNSRHQQWLQKYTNRTLAILHELHPTLFSPQAKNY